ncbi:MAG TPA: C25 family cysteine peptidase [Herpetosiphonaceae bacterium]
MRQSFWILLFIILATSGLAPSAIADAGFASNPLIDRAGALRIQVLQSGLQQLNGAQLQAAGWDLSTVNPRTIQLWRTGQEVPIDLNGVADGRLDPSDTIRFVSPRTTSRWSTVATYWLASDTVDGLRGTPQLAPGDPIRWEEDALYQTRWPSLNGDRWYGRELVSVPERDRTRIDLSLPVSAPAGTRLQLAVVGTTPQPHTLTLAANGRALDPLRWSGTAPYLGSVLLPFTVLPGVLQLDVTLAGSQADRVLLDWVALPDVRPAYPATPTTPRVERGPGFDPTFGPAPGQPGATFLIITHASLRPALDPLIAAHRQRGDTVGVVDVQTAYDAWSWGDRTPEAIRSLIRTAVTQWQPAPRAILLVGAGTVRMRVEPGATDPTLIPPYLVAADPIRGEIACDTCYTRLDAADPLQDLLPNLPIGRFPARTLAEAQTLVRKTVTALTAPPSGAWQTRALLLTDNDREPDGRVDPAGSFVATAETMMSVLPRGIHGERFYFAPDRPTGQGFYQEAAELRCRLFRALDGGSPHDRACPPLAVGTEPGAALWIYVGHGSPWQWAATTPTSPTPYLWYLYDADARTNGARLPILLSLTCLSGDWANPTLMTTDERMVLHTQGGAIASLSATGEGVNTAHTDLARGVLPTLFATHGDRTLGAAHLAGLRRVVASGTHVELAFSFGILGDPDVALPFVPTSTAWVPLVGRS